LLESDGTATLGPGRVADVARNRPAVLRLRCVGCEVLARSIYLCAARSPHVVDVALLRRRLHDTPATLREQVQAEIDAADVANPPYDAITLAYGLCGGAMAGVRPARVPLVLPRAHDCITLLLGSRGRYEREFTADPGTYWYTADYLERSRADEYGAETGLLGVGASSEGELERAYAEYVARFGKDNADYLIEVTGAWRAHYDRAVFLDMGIGDEGQAMRRARTEAEWRGWRFERMAGELLLIRRLLDADWDGDFLVVEPGQSLAMSYGADIVSAKDESDARSPEGAQAHEARR
jgi:hypothetical protein